VKTKSVSIILTRQTSILALNNQLKCEKTVSDIPQIEHFTSCKGFNRALYRFVPIIQCEIHSCKSSFIFPLVLYIIQFT